MEKGVSVKVLREMREDLALGMHVEITALIGTEYETSEGAKEALDHLRAITGYLHAMIYLDSIFEVLEKNED